jgi:hypothetical protein
MNAKTWIIHGASFALSILALVASPPAAVVALLGAHAALIIGGAGILYTAISGFLHLNTSATPGASGGSSTTGKTAAIVLALLTLPMLHGCATLTSPGAQPYLLAAVDVAVATAESKGIPATQINSIAKAAVAADTGTTATLAAISTLINGRLTKLNLPPGDLAAAGILEVALSAAISGALANNPNVAQAQTAIADVLNDVIQASGG